MGAPGEPKKRGVVIEYEVSNTVFDTTLEWYFHGTAAFEHGISYFDCNCKDLLNYIFNLDMQSSPTLILCMILHDFAINKHI